MFHHKRLFLLTAVCSLLCLNAQAANVTVDGATSFQTMNGVGSNVSSWGWKNGELKPALDAIVDTLGHNIFRVIHDRMEWAGASSTRPAATLTGLQNLDPTTLRTVYEVPDMQDLWNTIGYLNSKGVTGDQIMINFMGWTAVWMGGSGAYGVASTITNNAQTNQDAATMIASLVYYGHHRRDISGANANLNFSYIGPFNEIDLNGLEGPQLSASQLNTIYGNIVATLNAMGDTTTKLIGPDTASGPDTYTAAFSNTVKARMTHFSWHSYSGSSASPATPRSSLNADWLTETSEWCSGCDDNQPPSVSEWSFGSDIGDLLLGDIDNGFSALLTWESYDVFYYHHNSYSAWGHVGCTQNGSGCTTSDSIPRVYTVRGRAWPEATLSKAIRPGMVVRSVTTSINGLTVLAFYDAASGTFSLVGHNTNGTAVTLNAQLQNLPTMNTLAYYRTNSSVHLQRQTDVTVTGGAFTANVPADTFFYFANTSSSTTSICDVNKDNTTNVVDVQQCVNQSLGIATCTADINKDGICNVVDVQRVVNAALGGQCVSP